MPTAQESTEDSAGRSNLTQLDPATTDFGIDEDEDALLVTSGERPHVRKRFVSPAYRVGDLVIVVQSGSQARTGPVKIAKVNSSANPITYTLCFQDGTPYNNNAYVQETSLRAHT